MSGELYIFLFDVLHEPVFIAGGAAVVFVLFLIMSSAFRDLFSNKE